MPDSLPTAVIVDDHPSIAEGFRRFWRGSVNIVGTAVTAPSGVAVARRLKPDVVVMDLRLPGNPWTAIEKIVESTSSKVIVVTGGDSPKILDAAMLAGASGVVEKGISSDEILAAVIDVAKGEQHWGATWEDRLREIKAGHEPIPGVSDKDLEIINYLMIGTSFTDIALMLGIGPRQIQRRLDNMRERYQCENDFALAAFISQEQYVRI